MACSFSFCSFSLVPFISAQIESRHGEPAASYLPGIQNWQILTIYQNVKGKEKKALDPLNVSG